MIQVVHDGARQMKWSNMGPLGEAAKHMMTAMISRVNIGG